VRKTASLKATIPWLYLKGISTGEMQPALEALVGPEAKGLSASTGARLKQSWREVMLTLKAWGLAINHNLGGVRPPWSISALSIVRRL
jgi:hypothetical protein